MTPISYTKVGEIVKFRYRLSELKEWIRLGNKGGNVGLIRISIDYSPNGWVCHKGYGTIENPRERRYTFYSKHHGIFGPLPTPEEIIHPKTFDELYPNAGWFIPGSTEPVGPDYVPSIPCLRKILDRVGNRAFYYTQKP